MMSKTHLAVGVACSLAAAKNHATLNTATNSAKKMN
jgi:hypothetical protein